VASRAEAIERAVELGLLEDSRYPARATTSREPPPDTLGPQA
jgi:hypothetical protein